MKTLVDIGVQMLTADDGNRSTYYQRTRQQQARPTNIIPALNGHGEQQNLTRGVENIAPTPGTPTVASIAARQQQLQQQQQQLQQQAAMAAQGALTLSEVLFL